MLEVALTLFIGLALIYAEFFVPGGLLAIIGTLLIVLSIVLLYDDLPSLYYLGVYLTLVLGFLYLTVRLALWRIKKLENTLYLGGDQKGYSASTFNGSLVGEKGVTVTVLKPSGYVSIQGQRLQASSIEGYIDVGEPIRVVSGEGANLIVTAIRYEN